MKSRIDEILSQHVIEDIEKTSLSSWRMTLHFWLILTRREKVIAGLAGICREFSAA